MACSEYERRRLVTSSAERAGVPQWAPAPTASHVRLARPRRPSGGRCTQWRWWIFLPFLLLSTLPAHHRVGRRVEVLATLPALRRAGGPQLLGLLARVDLEPRA